MRSSAKAAALMLVVLMLPAREAAAQGKVGGPEKFLFDAANRERSARGLPALKWDAELAAAARPHAQRMAQQNTLSHQFPGEPDLLARARAAGARFSAVAENVADGPEAAEIHDGWMKSPPHRQNLLDPNLNSIGIAVAERDGQLFAAEDFSRAVADLSVEEQEGRVRAELKAHGLRVLNENADARRTCERGLGQPTSQRAAYALRYSTGDLDNLPDALTMTLRDGQYHVAAVGACAPPHGGNFAEYQVAVLLYE